MQQQEQPSEQPIDNPPVIRSELADRVEGECKQFISEEEKSWRTIDKLQQHPFKRVAKYQRNKSYQPHNTRTHTALTECISYLMNSLPKFISSTPSPSHVSKGWLFLQQALKAIRCQFYVQGIYPPKQLLQINKALIAITIINANQSKELPKVDFGNMQEIITDYKEELIKNYKKEYDEMLICMIFTCGKIDLNRVIRQHQEILQNQRLMHCLKLRLQIDNHMWYAYFDALQNQSMLVRVLLLLRLNEMQQYLLKVLPKIYLKVSRGDLLKWMGWTIEEEWADVRKQGWIKKQERQWISTEEIIAFLMEE